MATIVTAPDGYKSLKKGICYYLLKTPVRKERVLLVAFHEHAQKRVAERVRTTTIHVLSREDFENGLSLDAPGKEPSLVLAVKDGAMPPWLADIEGRDLDAEPKMLEPSGQSQRSLRDEVVDRLARIQPALQALNEILAADDPDVALNKFARKTLPTKTHETRFRLWFYLYLAFDRRMWTLLPPRFRCGRWDRLSEKYADSYLGRPSETHGRKHSHRTTPEMIDQVVDGFRKRGKSARSLRAVIADILRLDFGCKTRKLPNGKRETYHPEGKPFPTEHKCYYIIYKVIGRDEVKRVLLGDVRMRKEYEPFGGKISDGLYFAGERAHMDAAQVMERPKSYLSNKHLPPLKKTELVDAVTGQFLGVGFSLGGEDADAYKMALFCAAIPKTEFGRLIGLQIDEQDWPSVGMPANVVADGGPGGSLSVRKELNKWVVAFEGTPSYQPMSNATVESKHKRSHRKSGAPEYQLSSLTVIELIKREVLEIIRKNRSDDVSRRAPDRAVVTDEVSNPNQLYEYLVKRGRSSLIEVSFSDAVRSFLKPVEITAQDGQLSFRGHRYLVPAQHRQTLGREIVRYTKKTPLKGYVIPLVPLFAWVEFGGELIEVSAYGHDYDDALLVTDIEADQIAKARAKIATTQKQSVLVERIAAHEAFKATTGKEWFAGQTRRGRPKDRTPEQRDEMRRLKQTA